MPSASAAPFVPAPPLMKRQLIDLVTLKVLIKILPAALPVADASVIPTNATSSGPFKLAQSYTSVSSLRKYASTTSDAINNAVQCELRGAALTSSLADPYEDTFSIAAASVYAQSVLVRGPNWGARSAAVATSPASTWPLSILPSPSTLDGGQLAERLQSLVATIYVPLIKVVVSVVAQLAASASSSSNATKGAAPESLKSIRHASAVSLKESATKRLITAITPPSSPTANGPSRSELETSFVKHFAAIAANGTTSSATVGGQVKSDSKDLDRVLPPSAADFVSVLHQVHKAFTTKDEPMPEHTIICALRVALADWLSTSSAVGEGASDAAVTRSSCMYLLETTVPSTVVEELIAPRRSGLLGGPTPSSSASAAASSLTMAEVAVISSVIKDSPANLQRCGTFLMLQHYLPPEALLPRAVASLVEDALLDLHETKSAEGDRVDGQASKKRRLEGHGGNIKSEEATDDRNSSAHLVAQFPQIFSFNSLATRFAVRAYFRVVAAGAQNKTSAGELAADKETFSLTMTPNLAAVFASTDCSRFLLSHGATSLSETGRLFGSVGDEKSVSRATTAVKSEPSDESKVDVSGHAMSIYSGKPPSKTAAAIEASNRRCTQDFLLRLVNQFESCEGAALFKEPVYPSTIMNHSGAQLGPYAAVVKVPMSLALMRSCISASNGGFPSGKSGDLAEKGAAAATKKPLTSPTSSSASKVPFLITSVADIRKALWLIAANCSAFNAPEGPFPERARLFVNQCCRIVDYTVEMMSAVEV